MSISAQTIGLVTGWLLVGWVGLQALVVALQALRRRLRWQRSYAREKAEFCRRLEAAARAARASKAIPDWTGWRRFRVAAVVDESRDVKSFYFAPLDGRPLSTFAPGQYLTFRLRIPGSEAPLVRCYSLSDRPRQDFYRATIKRVTAPCGRADLPAGRGSSFFHDRVKVGDVLDVRAPAGTFLIDPRAEDPLVLIGAGIGVTPLVSMLEAIVHHGRAREVNLILGFRNGNEHPFRGQIARIATGNERIRLHVSYSAPRTGDLLHRDYTHEGRITIERVRQVLPSNNYHFYVCGPGPLMESLVPALWEWGVPESHVHFEAFGPASVRSAAGRAVGKDSQKCEVRFEQSNRTAVWDASFNSLLEFGQAAGVVMRSGCRAGSCGECMMAVRSGKVTTVKQPGIEVPPGQCLTCISVPAGELVLDA